MLRLFVCLLIAGALLACEPVDPGDEDPTVSVPTDPLTVDKGKLLTLTDAGRTDYLVVPQSYDGTHQTPIRLFVWLHGCGGVSHDDAILLSPDANDDDTTNTQTWITLAPGGTEGDCWSMSRDPATVMSAIANVKKHFNIAPKRVVVGGYSSGGDLSYRTAFYNALSFSGVLVINTSPFRATGSPQSSSLGAAAWKFNAVHVAHLQDQSYPIAIVRNETAAMVAAGFPMTVIERDGAHFNSPGDIVGGSPVPGTYADIRTYLLPVLDDGWHAP